MAAVSSRLNSVVYMHMLFRQNYCNCIGLNSGKQSNVDSQKAVNETSKEGISSARRSSSRFPIVCVSSRH